METSSENLYGKKFRKRVYKNNFGKHVYKKSIDMFRTSLAHLQEKLIKYSLVGAVVDVGC
jgi:hypothetical protein